ncbi:hypothetical protein EW145_g904 [Phellinidium pouzarii]|uniref:Calcineurin-like phosphoesterase domain-containing protein n=1 Tax=Phellinidium pouzarii TaxID=167371 RepID=A0A4V3XDU8_9AGAM|nr:hypothetical protein EW145_g904 [Phellinidium pouzarii]
MRVGVVEQNITDVRAQQDLILILIVGLHGRGDDEVLAVTRDAWREIGVKKFDVRLWYVTRKRWETLGDIFCVCLDGRAPSLASSTMVFFCLLALVAAATATAASAQSLSFGPSSFAASGAFPTSIYSKYYNDPTQTSAQVQPVISDPVTHQIYPFKLTNPATIPKNDTADPHPLPSPVSSSTLLKQALRQIQLIASPETENSPFLTDSCAACQAGLGFGKMIALAAPEQGPALAVGLCEAFDESSDCSTTVGPLALGNVITQVLANADVAGYDGQLICNNFYNMCPLPPTSALNLTGWFAKPKPNPLPPPKTPSGKRLKVLHLSDFHLDPRYTTGAEANCTSNLCCREGNVASSSPNETIFPAPRFGSYRCDTPFALAGAALESIPVLAGTHDDPFDFMVYTGDLVSHDPDNELSREYILNYDHVAGLWEHEGWLPESAISLSRAHYGAYMVRRTDGLRIITLNTDFWYTANWFNYFNMTQIDTSGMFRFLTDELQDAEDAGDRVWILGHVLSGWDGTNPLQNPTNLYIFWGHTHEDQLSIYYANNGTNMTAETAQAVSWIAPSLTPLTNLNSGFRVYEVDSNTFDIVDAHTWRADVNAFPELDDQITFAPTFAFEYDTRATYGQNISGWGPNDPLNATWWHLVTEGLPPFTCFILWKPIRLSSRVGVPDIMSIKSFRAFVLFNFLRHGPNIMLYPGAFEPSPRQVHLPSAWGLPYEDLTLTTADRVKIRAYLLLQPEREQPRKSSIDYSISAIIAENTFTSLRRLIQDVLPVFSFVAPFFRQWNSVRRLAELPRTVSLLLLSGQRDEVIPPAHMRQLWEAATRASPVPFSRSKKRKAGSRLKFEQDRLGAELMRDGRLVEIPGGSHNDTWDDPTYWDAVEAFIEGLPVDSFTK